MTKRKSGILLHPTSLPSSFGVGDLGKAAFTFVDKLAEAEQTLWQVLPLVPADDGGSPYSSCSAFAGNPLLISPEKLMEDGYLTEADLLEAAVAPAPRVDYGRAKAAKLPLLEKAYRAFLAAEKPADYAAFCEKNAFWLDDYVLYMALKEHFRNARAAEETTEAFDAFAAECEGLGLTEKQIRDYYIGANWVSFPKNLKKRNTLTLKKWRKDLADAVEKEIFLQYIFAKQWQTVKAYANEKGISIIGDAPIFVAYDSADVWANQKLFRLDKNGFPTCITGVPPDYFSETGQLWGNPHYDWKQHEKTGFAWWISRIQKTLGDVDILRIDHFRGFEACWEVAFGAEDARGGKWVKAPGKAFFTKLKEVLGEDLPLIAEDLGTITKEVLELREFAGLPGMRILQFAFGGDKNNAYLPHSYDRNTVVYTGTHDNDTTKGWYEAAPEAEKDHYRRYMNADGSNVAWDMIRLALSSSADLAIIPLQDVMALGKEHRMNIPGTSDGNWGFTFSFGWWWEGFTDGLKYHSALFGRNQKPAPEKEETQEDMTAEETN
ncbi:MAG: 4-alpha-glucanotransferase [Bacillota bacterium]|nr:4-alpha-glucanotransferase [Bacillota bacterium]